MQGVKSQVPVIWGTQKTETLVLILPSIHSTSASLLIHCSSISPRGLGKEDTVPLPPVPVWIQTVLLTRIQKYTISL